MTDDGTIYLRDATAAPQALRVVPPTGSQMSRALPFPASPDHGGMASAGSGIWVIQDVNILQRSEDGGLTWTAVSAR
ncbi:MAG: hypothetical protein ABJA74_01295 [Lapillicoccus sp.]